MIENKYILKVDSRFLDEINLRQLNNNNFVYISNNNQFNILIHNKSICIYSMESNKVYYNKKSKNEYYIDELFIKSFTPILTFPQIFFEKCLESIFICYTDATKSFNYLHLIENNNHSYTYSSQTSMIFKYTNGFLSYFKDFSQGQEIILLKGG